MFFFDKKKNEEKERKGKEQWEKVVEERKEFCGEIIENYYACVRESGWSSRSNCEKQRIAFMNCTAPAFLFFSFILY